MLFSIPYGSWLINFSLELSTAFDKIYFKRNHPNDNIKMKKKTTTIVHRKPGVENPSIIAFNVVKIFSFFKWLLRSIIYVHLLWRLICLIVSYWLCTLACTLAWCLILLMLTYEFELNIILYPCLFFFPFEIVYLLPCHIKYEG